MDESFEYRTQGRRPGTYFAFGVWLLLAAVAWENGAPPLAWGALAFFVTVVGWWLCRNPSFGIRISDRDWLFRCNGVQWRVPLHQVDSLVHHPSGAGAGYVLRLIDGTCATVPRRCLPPRARIEPILRRRGIRLVDAAGGPAWPA